MKKQYKIISLSLCACLLTGCATVQSTAQDLIASAKALVGLETEEEDSTYVPPEGSTQVTGLVLTAYGNEITLQLAADSSSTGGDIGEMPEGMTQGEGMTGEMSEGMGSGEGMTGEMSEGMGGGEGMTGEMSEGMTQGEGMTGEMSEGMTQGEGMTGEMPDRDTETGTEGMSEDTTMGEPSTETSTDTAGNSGAGTSNSNTTMGGNSAAMGEMSGGMGEMSGEMSGMGEMSGEMGGMSGSMDASATVDYSSIITLGDETALYVIPTGTVVEYYGFEMTFSQIAAEQYITITISEDGYILYVEVLG